MNEYVARKKRERLRETKDGRLCEESSGKYYKLREAIKLSEELGRPLTSQEYETFRIDSKEH